SLGTVRSIFSDADQIAVRVSRGTSSIRSRLRRIDPHRIGQMLPCEDSLIRAHAAVGNALREELTRSGAGELAEVSVEVRLVVVAAAQGDVDPANLARGLQQADGLLEAEDARHRFRRDTELLAELHRQVL